MTVKISPLNDAERLADLAMTPIMKGFMLASGHLHEHSQMTHFWNNWKGSFPFDPDLAVQPKPDPKAAHVGGLRRHLPAPFGWQQYCVLEPKNKMVPFHIGWVGGGVSGISRIRNTKPVRVLLGPKPVTFIGFNPDGEQIPIQVSTYGKLGDMIHGHLPLI